MLASRHNVSNTPVKSLKSLKSLRSLKVGESGVIIGIGNAKPTVTDQLRQLGLTPGQSITLEQRFPRLVIRNRGNSLALTQDMFQAINVRPRSH